MKKNVFNSPSKYIEQIKLVRMSKEKQKRYLGKSILCVWLTKLCPAKCKSCFFKSDMYCEGKPKEKYEFSKHGLEQLIKWINDSNNGYLMLSGGGEPMIKRFAVNEIIRKAKTDRIVIVTSGIWGKTYGIAEKIIDELYESFKQRNDDAVLILRLSIDSFHYESIGYEVLENIINVFKDKYQKEKNFELRIHTMINDKTLDQVALKLGNCKVIYNDIETISDNNEVIKIMPKQGHLIFGDGYNVMVGRSKLFLSNLKVDLNKQSEDIQKALDVFEEDMSISEYGNPSTITNTNGRLGLDFWCDYNGNITTWGNQQWDKLYNVYIDNYDDLVNGTLENIISYSFIDKGYYYRERIVKDVNPLAVLRSKVINLRDYAGALLMEEDRTKLYYGIVVIKDYLEDGIMTYDDLKCLSKELINEIKKDRIEIINDYKESDYDFIKQNILNTEFDKDKWSDLFFLIKLGHYDIRKENLDKALSIYNQKTNSNYTNLLAFVDEGDSFQYGRLHNRISLMKKEAEVLCLELNNFDK